MYPATAFPMPFSRSFRSLHLIHSGRAAPIVVPLILLCVGCAGGSRPATVTPTSACIAGTPGGAPAESMSVATTAPVNPAHAPAPSTGAERFVFAQVYETLIAVDCEGRVYPGLARSWTTDATKTRVTLLLRDGARFSNGDPIAATDVVAAWRATATASPDSGELARRIADATTIVDDHTLTVSLPDTEWLVLAEPMLAVYRPRTGAAWPLGSGPYRAAEAATDIAPGRLSLLPVPPRTGPRLTIRSTPDARDAIDAGVDLLLAADQAALSYAASRSDLTTVPLPWQRTYVLAVPSRTAGVVTELLSSTSDSAITFRASLARDAVRAEARAAEPDWLAAVQGCESNQLRGATPGDVAQRARRIVFRGDDHVARELAARLVAVGRGVASAPLAAADFARALRAGNELAYVIGLPRGSLAPCHELAALVSAAPWMREGGTVTSALIPLIDTRERAVVKRDRVSASIDWDGTLKINGTGSRP